MPLIYTDKAGRAITVIKYLPQENALVLGFKHGAVAVFDPQNPEKAIEISKPTSYEVTTIVARPVSKTKHFKHIDQTLVVVGDKGGNVTKIRVKRNDTLSCLIKKTAKIGNQEIKAITISSKIDFACGDQDGTHLLTDQIGKHSTLDKTPPVALLPIIGTAAFIAIYIDGSNTIFGDTSRFKKGRIFPNKLFSEDIFSQPRLADVKGIIRYDKQMKEIASYDLVALTEDGNLLLTANAKRKRVLANNIIHMDLAAQISHQYGNTSIILTCTDKTGNTYYGDLSNPADPSNFANFFAKDVLGVNSIAASPFKPVVYAAKGTEIHELNLLQPQSMSSMSPATSSSSSSPSSSSATATTSSPSKDPYGFAPGAANSPYSQMPVSSPVYGGLPEAPGQYGTAAPAQPSGPYDTLIPQQAPYGGLPVSDASAIEEESDDERRLLERSGSSYGEITTD